MTKEQHKLLYKTDINNITAKDVKNFMPYIKKRILKIKTHKKFSTITLV